ncbi:MAG: hypothetical protein ABI867_28500 [Kofleriaceae bacterium]
MVVLTVTWMCAACDTVDGGAAELSWKLRPSSSDLADKFVDCDSGEVGTGPITAIQLKWQVGDEVGLDEWSCGDSHGVTGFALPPGSALFSVVPICGIAEASPDSYIAPPVQQRNVILGNTVSLGAIELVVNVSQCGPTRCICN